jgi:hypothetical protein
MIKRLNVLNRLDWIFSILNFAFFKYDSIVSWYLGGGVVKVRKLRMGERLVRGEQEMLTEFWRKIFWKAKNLKIWTDL